MALRLDLAQADSNGENKYIIYISEEDGRLSGTTLGILREHLTTAAKADTDGGVDSGASADAPAVLCEGRVLVQGGGKGDFMPLWLSSDSDGALIFSAIEGGDVRRPGALMRRTTAKGATISKPKVSRSLSLSLPPSLSFMSLTHLAAMQRRPSTALGIACATLCCAYSKCVARADERIVLRVQKKKKRSCVIMSAHTCKRISATSACAGPGDARVYTLCALCVCYVHALCAFVCAFACAFVCALCLLCLCPLHALCVLCIFCVL